MKVELHCHTTRYSGCAVATPAELMRKFVATGYEAVYITEHDAVWQDWEIAQLQEKSPGIRIFPGVELSVGSMVMPLEHLLVLGTSDPEYLIIRRAAELLEKARSEGHLTILAHPTRWEGGAAMLDEGLLPDAIEYRTCNQDARRAGLAEALAGRLSLPLVNASDAHALGFLDRFWIETHPPIERADDIRRIVLEGAYQNCFRGE